MGGRRATGPGVGHQGGIPLRHFGCVLLAVLVRVGGWGGRLLAVVARARGGKTPQKKHHSPINTPLITPPIKNQKHAAYRVQTVVTLDGVRVRMRDYARSALGKAVNREDRNAAIVKAFVEHGGRQVGREGGWVRDGVCVWGGLGIGEKGVWCVVCDVGDGIDRPLPPVPRSPTPTSHFLKTQHTHTKKNSPTRPSPSAPTWRTRGRSPRFFRRKKSPPR